MSTAYDLGATKAAYTLGLQKQAASALRRRFSLKETGPGIFTAAVGETPLTTVTMRSHTSPSIKLVEPMPDRLRGMGLGKKLYGELARRMPNQTLESDNSVSDAARRVWTGMRKRPGYRVRENPDYLTEGGPLFQATLPSRSAISIKPVAGKRTALSPTQPNTAQELTQLAQNAQTRAAQTAEAQKLLERLNSGEASGEEMAAYARLQMRLLFGG